jgi:poly(hydroxyalkanoate) granule-associated protein
MIENINEFLGTVARTELGKTARRSARTIWNAHVNAFETTRDEAGKVLGAALEQGQKATLRGRSTAEGMVENLAGVADERFATIEEAFQQGVSRVIRRIGLPTAKDVHALTRRVDALAAKVEARAAKKPRRRAA